MGLTGSRTDIRLTFHPVILEGGALICASAYCVAAHANQPSDKHVLTGPCFKLKDQHSTVSIVSRRFVLLRQDWLGRFGVLFVVVWMLSLL